MADSALFVHNQDRQAARCRMGMRVKRNATHNIDLQAGIPSLHAFYCVLNVYTVRD